ncbi:hypothetical protein FQR65_LT11122 [Abscondita terminalis]|nr:hypothetical protein FQR65_LT11122 [Abscondita terminalis]
MGKSDWADFFSKYIYLESPNFIYKNKLKLKEDCVYILTVKSDQNLDENVNVYNKEELENKCTPFVPPKPTSSSISVTSKKSIRGNILSNLFNKTRKKNKKTDVSVSDTTLKTDAITEETYFSEDEQSDNSSQPVIKEIPSKSKIPILKPNSSKVNIQKMLLLQKFTVKNVGMSETDSGKCRSYVSIITPTDRFPELPKRSKSDAEMESVWKCSLADTYMPTYKLETFDLNAKLAMDLQEVIAILSQLKQSEVHIVNLISKFIDDRSFQKQLCINFELENPSKYYLIYMFLVDLITNHSKLYVTAELRTQNLTTEMWLYQNEVLKNQEIAMQERLTSVIKHNRLLQSKIEQLMSKNEKLCIKIQQFPSCSRPASDGVLVEVTNRNDQLRDKVDLLSKQIDSEQSDLAKLQNKYILLQKQLQNSNLQLQNYKDIIDRLQNEGRLEQEMIINELGNNQKVLKESAEAGDVVLEDLDSLRRQFKAITCTINWTKFKCRGSSLPDLIYMCRSCINELSKELLCVQNQIALKNKDIHEIEKEHIKSEHDALQEKLYLFSIKEAELRSYKTKCEEGEQESQRRIEDMQKICQKYKSENVVLQESVVKLDVIKREILEKNEELILVKEQISEYKAENDTLRMQLHGLKQVLSATGTAEIAREMAEAQEKLVTFQSQYYQILSEKNVLIEKLQSVNLERASLNQIQTSSSKLIQKQQHEIESLNKDCLELKKQLENEQKQCIALTIEKNKLKDEKVLLKHICSQLKSEVKRVQDLEGKVAGMNMEANKLALIAEFNMQLGEKLQCEVDERDVKITELQSSMKELNNAQLETTKDKVALCVELKEVCSLNDQLNTTLEFEQQKMDELHQMKKLIEDTASLKLRAAEQMQKKERTVLIELLKEYKIIVAQRDNLVTNQTELMHQITELRANILVLSKNLEESHLKSLEQNQVVKDFESNLRKSQNELEKITNVVETQKRDTAEIKKQWSKTQEQKESLEETITYLQNTVQQLHKDLNKVRESEINVTRMLENEKKHLNVAENLVKQHKESLEHAQSTNEELTRRAAKLNSLYDELLQNYKNDMEINNDNVENLRRALHKSNDVITHQKQNVKDLQEFMAQNEKDINTLKDQCDRYKRRITDMEDALGETALQSQRLEDCKTQQNLLQSNFDMLRQNYDDSCCVITSLKEDNESLHKQLRENVEKAQLKCNFYKSCIQEISSQYFEDRQELQQDLETFAIEFQDLRSSFATESKEKERLMKQQKLLAKQLLTATQMIIDEKRKYQQVNLNVESLSQENNKLLEEKEHLNQTNQRLLQEVDDLKMRNRGHMSDKKRLHQIVAYLEKVRSDLQGNLKSSETEIKRVRQKGQYFENYIKETLQTSANNLKEVIKVLKIQLNERNVSVKDLESEVSKLRQELMALGFQKNETTLHLHKLEASLRTEQNINDGLLAVNQKIVTNMLKIDNQSQLTTPNTKYVSDSETHSVSLNPTM